MSREREVKSQSSWSRASKGKERQEYLSQLSGENETLLVR